MRQERITPHICSPSFWNIPSDPAPGSVPPQSRLHLAIPMDVQPYPLLSTLLLILGILIMPAPVLSENTLHLSYLVSNQNTPEQKEAKIEYTIHRKWTKVVHPTHLYMLNYAAGQVLRKEAGGTTRFKLNSEKPTPQQKPISTKSTAAAYKIFPTEDKQIIGGLPAVKKIIRFGYELDRFRTMGPVQHTAFGEVFRPRTVYIWVSDQHELYRQLRTLSQTRQKILKAAPFLAQLDLTLLVPQLEGVPLRIEEHKGTVRQILGLKTAAPLH